jgi:hypothetical protein
MITRYVAKYAPLSRDQSLREFLAPVRPGTDMNQKLHAILVLMEEYKDDIAQGMKISPDLVVESARLVHSVGAHGTGALSLITSLEN